MKKTLLLAIVAALLSGCFYPTERRIVSRGWVKPQLAKDHSPLYCYRTLGVVDCYARPLAGRDDGRLVNSYRPAHVAPPTHPAAR